MTADVRVRPLRGEDAVVTTEIAERAFRQKDAALGHPAEPEATDEQRRLARRRVEHLVATDPGGAWCAERDGRVLGAALALRRGPLWGLSLLVVEPEAQGAGLGALLLEAALAYGDGVQRWTILSSADPRAMRRYFRAGFALHPQSELHGRVDRSGLSAPAPDLREGDAVDLDLCAEVDTGLRGAPHTVDLAMLLDVGLPLLVVDGARGRGYAVARAGQPMIVGATAPDVAADLLTACLAEVPEGEGTEIRFVAGGNDWAIDVGLRARLALRPAGPVFWRGATPPAPYLPSGAYL